MKIKLNLLPEEQKEYLYKQRVFSITLQQIIYIVIIIFIFIGIIASVNVVLRTQLDVQKETLTSTKQQKNYQKIEELKVLSKELNTETKKIQRVQWHNLQWSQLFIMLEETIVGGIEYESVLTEGADVTVKGFARTREALTQQIEALSNVQQGENICFSDVNAADDDLFKKENFNFTLTFIVNDQCLKAQ